MAALGSDQIAAVVEGESRKIDSEIEFWVIFQDQFLPPAYRLVILLFGHENPASHT